MDDVAKYKLELKSKDETYTRCRIGGLDMAYMKCSWSKNPDQLETLVAYVDSFAVKNILDIASCV
jgi:hypothetical protein